MPAQIDIPASFAGGADVSGKRVVITGAGRGLGRLLAHAFSHGGARVTLVARTERDLKAVADELPGLSLVCSGDVTDEEFNEAVADATVAEWGGARRVDLQRRHLADPRRTARHRRRGLARDRRREPHGRVPRGARREPCHAQRRTDDLHRFGARRTAARRPRRVQRVEGRAGRLGQGLALDLAPAGITVNVVAPGWFDSPLAEPWKNNAELGTAVLDHTAQRRWGAPTDLAGAYQFLASDASAFVTGTVLNVDGGYLLV